MQAAVIARLQARAARVDSALPYGSDHAESLGENGLYLHGLPYAIAPKAQTHLPMVMWLSEGLRRGDGLDSTCLKQRAALPASHDHLFYTLLGQLDVRTALYAPGCDLMRGCRTKAVAAR